MYEINNYDLLVSINLSMQIFHKNNRKKIMQIVQNDKLTSKTCI